MRDRVAIIGAGVSGLTCGVLLAEHGLRVAIFAAEATSCTTSAAAAAIWFPYDAQPADAVIRWSLESYHLLRALSANPDSGVSMIELRVFRREGASEIPSWANPLGARMLPPSVIPRCFASGFRLDVPLMDTTIYLDYLADRFRNAGGEIHGNHRLDALEEVSTDYRLVVNCAGIGARTLVPDEEVEPHRGQVAVVEKLELAHAMVCNDLPLMYAIPRRNDCVFGGTNELSADLAPDSGGDCADRRGMQPCPGDRTASGHRGARRPSPLPPFRNLPAGRSAHRRPRRHSQLRPRRLRLHPLLGLRAGSPRPGHRRLTKCVRAATLGKLNRLEGTDHVIGAAILEEGFIEPGAEIPIVTLVVFIAIQTPDAAHDDQGTDAIVPKIA